MHNFKSTPDSLKQIFKAFGRTPSLGAPDNRRRKPAANAGKCLQANIIINVTINAIRRFDATRIILKNNKV